MYEEHGTTHNTNKAVVQLPAARGHLFLAVSTIDVIMVQYCWDRNTSKRVALPANRAYSYTGKLKSGTIFGNV